MTKPAPHVVLSTLLSLYFPSCFPSPLPKPLQDKVFIVLEHPEGWGGAPEDLEDLIYGVFLDKKRATERLDALMSYYYSRWGSKLFLDEGTAKDENDIPVYRILERYITL